MAVSQEQVAAQSGAAGDVLDSEAADRDVAVDAARAADRADVAALQAKRLFLDRVIAWHEAGRCGSARRDPAREGADLLSLRVADQLSPQALRRALSEERNVLLRF